MGTGASKDNSSGKKKKNETAQTKKQQEEQSHKALSKAKVNDVTATIVKVNVSKAGFWPPAVTVKEGQCVVFSWNEPSGNGHNIRQVVFGAVNLQSAVGGYLSGDLKPHGKYKIQFNLEGEFKFVSDGFHSSTKPFVVTVHLRTEIPAEVTDKGFSTNILRINQGNTVKWTWNSTSVPHKIYEVKLCPKHCGLLPTNTGSSVASASGSYKHEFKSPGLYYFQTEGEEEGTHHLCIVHVRERQSEFRIDVTDRKFSPRLLTIKQGDRVWWEWDRLKEEQEPSTQDDETSSLSDNHSNSPKCKKGHNIIQVDVPQYSDEIDPYPKPVKGGFRCEAPSRSGVLSHVFSKTGVYYYCDQDYDDNREYLGVILVKPKEREHYIELTSDGFYPDLGAISAGDRVWWIWDPQSVQDHFSIMEVDRCLAGNDKVNSDRDCNNLCSYVNNDDATLISCIGIETIQLNTVGVYHYRVSDSPVNVGCSSIIVNPKPKDHVITVSDSGFDPRVSTLYPGDRVWWIWEDCKEEHNIIQVSHQGRPIKDGFCSGAPLDSPGAFVYQFSETGVYYFISIGQPKAFGAIVISSQPLVSQVRVSKNTIQPDPVLALTNDVVVWMWPGLRKHGITQVADTKQVYELQSYTQDIVTPRRCFALKFSTPNIYHYYSKAFSGNDDKYLYEHSSKCVLSTVIINNASDSVVVHVSSNKGFKPNTVNILRGHSVLWSWKDCEEDEVHNIVHVNPPDHEKPYTPVSDETAFDSGPAITNNSFIYTFDEPGSYFVASQGTPGYVGTVNVLDKEVLTAMPVISSDVNGGTVERWHTVYLQCSTDGSTIFYTLDGSNPEYHGQFTKIYKPNKGIILRESGLQVIRAMAVSDDALNSKIFTSKRFWILEGEKRENGDEEMVLSTEEDDEEDDDFQDTATTMKWHWWNCVPEVQGWIVSPGCVEVYWEMPEDIYKPQIKTYQVYVNNVCYCEALPSDCHSVRILGFAGGCDYIIKIVALPKDSQFLPQESNKLRVHIPERTKNKGPLISCEIQYQPDVMAIVWMAIHDKENPVTSYRLYVNDQKCGDEVVPDEGSNKCKVVIQGCEINTLYKVCVIAEQEGNENGLVSNELPVLLPQTTQHIILPQGRSLLEEDLQCYITVTRGTGHPPDAERELLPSTQLTMELDLDRSYTHTETILTQTNIHLEEQQENQVKEHAECSDDHNVNAASDDDSNARSNECEQSVWRASSSDSSSSESGSSSESDEDELVKQNELDEGEEEKGDESEREEEREEEVGEGNNDLKRSKETADSDTEEVLVEEQIHDQEEEKMHLETSDNYEMHDDINEHDTYINNASESDHDKDSNHDNDKDSNHDNDKVSNQDVDSELHGVAVMHTLMDEHIDEQKDVGPVQEKEQKKKKKKRKKKDENEIDVVAKAQKEIQELPVPKICCKSEAKKPEIQVEWNCEKSQSKRYILQHYLVCVIGTKFGDVQSHNSFETGILEGKVCYQHCWTVKESTKLKISELAESTQYKVYVSCVFTRKKRTDEKVEVKSEEVICVSGGRPSPPILSISNIGLHQVCLSWESGLTHPDVILKGYQVYLNFKELGELLSPQTTSSLIQDIAIGASHHVYVESVTDLPVGNSEASNVVTIVCPQPLDPPSISCLPSVKNCAALIVWPKPKGPDSQLVAAYRIYVDNKEVGELDVKKSDCRGNSYQYYITDLQPGVSYDVTVRTYTGQKEADLYSGIVYCGVLSSISNVLPVMCTAPPKSPRLRLEGLHNHGIDVTWEIPQQYGDAALSGFQMVKDGKLYGSIIAPDVLSTTVSGVTLGDVATLQIVALTNHPVGKLEHEGSIFSGSDSGIDNTSAIVQDEKGILLKPPSFPHQPAVIHLKPQKGEELPLMEKFSACKPGPKLMVSYTGLVQPPSKVWSENLTGHSAIVAWTTDEKKKKHYVSPENYQVTWWPGDNPDTDIRSQSTTNDHITISGLKPATKYTVIVEARRAQLYSSYIEEESEERDNSTFILTAQSEQLCVTTGCPPEPPTNIGVITSRCNSLQIAWHSPVEHGIEVIGLRVYVFPSENKKVGYSQCMELLPDITSLMIQDLAESTEYIIHVLAITQEYFDQLPSRSKRKKKSHSLSKDWEKVPKDSPWLPYASMHAITSGTHAPADLTCVTSAMDTIVVKWTPPQVLGTNKLESCVVRWSEESRSKTPRNGNSRGSLTVHPEDTMAEITSLMPGRNYKILVEAHILVKMTLEEQKNSDSDYRNAQVASDVIIVRTKAPVNPPELFLTGYSSNHITLYWEKPVLFTAMQNKDMSGCSSCIKRNLVGYRLDVNGRTHTRLGPAAQNCTLTNCRCDKKYTIVLVALTTTENERNRRKKIESKEANWRDSSSTISKDDKNEEYDEAPSQAIDVILPKPQPGALVSLEAKFTRSASKKNANEHRYGFINIEWCTQKSSDSHTPSSTSGIQGFDVSYVSSHDDKEHTKSLPPNATSYELPIKTERLIYDISVQPIYDDDYYFSPSQNLTYQCPGSPDPPMLCCTSIHSDHFTIEWGEPTLYGGVEIKGYQTYMNDKKIGNVLNPLHRKAIVPCRPNKQYIVSLVALSADTNFDNSLPSEDVVVVTPSCYPGSDSWRSTTSTCSVDTAYTLIQDVDVSIRDVTDTMITIKWSVQAVDDEDMKYIKLQWSSVANPKTLETKLAADETEYTIYRCTPGTNHFIKIYVIGKKDRIICKSKQYTVQTSDAIATPVLSLRSCTFTHTIIDWLEPGTYGDTELTGYKLMINEKEEAQLPSDVTNYTFTKGEMCKEYRFTLQALCSKAHLNSSLSEILRVTWPGVLPPTLRRVPTNKRNSLKVAWNDLYSTGGVKIASFKGVCVEVTSENHKRRGSKNEVVRKEAGPLHPDARTTEFVKLMPHVEYEIYLEIFIHGLDTAIKSDPIYGQVATIPGPPDINVSAAHVDERCDLNIETCRYINERDRLLQHLSLYQYTSVDSPGVKPPDAQAARLSSTLVDVENSLKHCLLKLEKLSGTMYVDVEWTPAEDDGDALVNGYQVLVNGKQYGSLLNTYVNHTRLKLNAYDLVHRISIVTVTNHPVGNSEPSDEIAVFTEPFLPFATFCFHNIHSKDVRFPEEGCCAYSDSLSKELNSDSLGTYNIAAVNLGTLRRRVPPAAVTVLDVFEGAWHLLIPTKLRKPTIILFWTKWCLASKIAMKSFVRYSRGHGKRISFITCCCASYESTTNHRHSLAEVIVENAWRDDKCIRHCCSCHSTSPGFNPAKKSTANNKHKSGKGLVRNDSNSSSDSSNVTGVAELFGIQGVPTMVVIHSDGHIAWQGRYAAYEYPDFESFTDHMLCEVMETRCPVTCDHCKLKSISEEPKLKPIAANPKSVRVVISEPSTSSTSEIVPLQANNWVDTDPDTSCQLPRNRRGKHRRSKDKMSEPQLSNGPSLQKKSHRPKSSYSQ